MKRIIGFVLIVILVSFCDSVFAATADTARYPYEMTGEELVALLLADTEDTLWINSTRFSSEVKLPPETHIRRTVILQTCFFHETAEFSQSYFSGDTYLIGSTFLDSADFGACTFSGKAIFSGNTFSDEAHFGLSTFSGDAVFAASTFSGDAVFSACTFSGDADFEACTFSGTAFFMLSTFSGKASFRLSRWHCIAPNSVEPVPGRADFSATKWGDGLFMEYIETRPGVSLDFTGAKWKSVPKGPYGKPKPVLYLAGADYDKLLFPVADENVPRPLLGFDSTFLQTGWILYYPGPNKIEWPVIQRTYGKFLTFLKESGRYDDYDVLFTEFHDLETHYKWYKKDYLSSAFTFMMGLICGYGIDPVQAFRFSLWVILGSTCIYLIFGKYIRPRYEKGGENAFQPPYFLLPVESRLSEYDPPQKLRSYRFSLSHLWPKDIHLMRMAWWLIVWRIFVVLRGAWLIFWYLMNFVLFSVNTFCTVGYDNNYPVKGLRYVCMAELVLGYITLTLFLVSLVNILIR